ncbi:hypothetical protein [Longimicrobium terrae]|uniref:Restriction endonuclease n=1 Tax=Longimicrobium terrae TaxID=1639882 RepID=A0A841H2F6_9BACT|nr:hypothetical protein [Longimicrobium terrae]MBB4637874.1 hypothetical protein [Longimicrobium terrae]MBB6072271.1 hypothetical protein [Longimicrobium terrae]NNC31193.1 hypothetical protein [Longimicrobium terrae]
MSDQDSVSKIELSKALKAVQAVASRSQFDQVLAILVPDEDQAVQQAILGLSEEDEFALLCRLMETATHISPLEQRPIIRNNSIAPDFLVQFQVAHPTVPAIGNSEPVRCFVEVKSTKKERFKIGGSNLRQRRAFADAFGFPLFIAVRFLSAGQHALWAIVHDVDRAKTSLTITPQDVLDGVRSLVWNELGYYVRPGLFFEAEFDSTSQDDNVLHPVYGTQTKFRAVADHASIESTGASAFFTSMLFECFDLREVQIQRMGAITIQRLEPRINNLLLADIVFRINQLLREDDGRLLYDASRALARIDTQGDKYLLKRWFVEKLIEKYVRESFVFLGKMGDSDRQMQNYVSLLNTR